MASRRSRLQIKPNIGPKPGLQRAGTKPDTKQSQEPKKSNAAKTQEPPEKTEKVIQPEPVQEKLKKEPVQVEKKSEPSSENKDSVDCTDLVEKVKEKKDKTVSTKDAKENQEQKVEKKPEVRPKLRSRFPKAKPNLANIGRPERKPVEPKPQAPPVISEPVAVEDVNTPQLISPPEKPEPTIQVNVEHIGKQEPAREESKIPDVGCTEVAHVKSQPAPVLETEGSSDEESVIDEKPAERSIFDKPLTPILKHDKRPLRKSLGGKKKSRVLPSIDEPPDRTKMRMIDLIYWNPSSNPMKKRVVKEKPKDASTTPDKQDSTTQEKEKEKTDTSKDAAEEDESSALFVPQVTIGPDGNIIVNESSLVIDNKVGDEPMESEVIEEDESTVNYTSFREKRSKSSWSELETKKFYKALSTVGTDFSLMLNLFPSRTRQEIKNKFKKEERLHRTEVDKAIRNRTQFDMTDFEKFEEEVAEEERLKKEKLEAKKTEISERSKVRVAKRKKEKDNVKENKNVKRRKKKRKSKEIIFDDDDADTGDADAESFMSDEEEENEAPLPRHLSDKVKEVVDILVDLRRGRRPPPHVEGDVSDAESEAPSEAPSEAQSVASELSVFVPKNVRTILSKKIKTSNVEEDRTVDNEIPTGDIGDLVNNLLSDHSPAVKPSPGCTPQAHPKRTVSGPDEVTTVPDEVDTSVVDDNVPHPVEGPTSTSVPAASENRVVSSDVQQMDIPESLLPVINQAGGADKVQIVLVHDTDAVTGRTMVHVYVLPKAAEQISIGGSTVHLTPTKNRPQDPASQCSTSSQDITISQCSTSGQVTVSHCASPGEATVSQSSAVQDSQGLIPQLNSKSVPVTDVTSTTVPPIPPSPATPFQRLSSKSVTLAQTGTQSAMKGVPSTSVTSLPVSTLLTPGVSSISSPFSTQNMSPLRQSLSSVQGLSPGLSPGLSALATPGLATTSGQGGPSRTTDQVEGTPLSPLATSTSASRVCLFRDEPSSSEAVIQAVVKKEG